MSGRMRSRIALSVPPKVDQVDHMVTPTTATSAIHTSAHDPPPPLSAALRSASLCFCRCFESSPDTPMRQVLTGGLKKYVTLVLHTGCGMVVYGLICSHGRVQSSCGAVHFFMASDDRWLPV